MEEINVMYFHGTTVDGCRYTISGVIKESALNLGIAICSKAEPFSKAKGRSISTGRVLSQRSSNGGRTFVSLYSGEMGDEYRGQGGYPTNYFKGIEIKVFRSYVKNFNHFTKKELQQEFGLLHVQPRRILYIKSNM